MNIRDIKYLLAVADLGHFGEAAKRCFVSQPTLSTQLKKLEETLGVTLFERTNKQVMITPVGREIVQQARIAMHNIDQLQAIADNAQDPLAGRFRLGVIPTLGPYLLPHILASTAKKLPNLEWVVCENQTAKILQQLREGDLDAIILALPVHTDGLVVTELFVEPFYVALPKENLLAKHKQLSMKDLNDQSLLLLEEGHCLRDQALEACGLEKARYSGFQATSLETLRHIVAMGSGITLMPALALDVVKQDPQVVIRPFVSPMPSRSIGMLWRETSIRQVACQKIASLVGQAIKKQTVVKANSKKKVMHRQLD